MGGHRGGYLKKKKKTWVVGGPHTVRYAIVQMPRSLIEMKGETRKRYALFLPR